VALELAESRQRAHGVVIIVEDGDFHAGASVSPSSVKALLRALQRPEQ
jgi:hypothetical protein